MHGLHTTTEAIPNVYTRGPAVEMSSWSACLRAPTTDIRKHALARPTSHSIRQQCYIIKHCFVHGGTAAQRIATHSHKCACTWVLSHRRPHIATSVCTQMYWPVCTRRAIGQDCMPPVTIATLRAWAHAQHLIQRLQLLTCRVRTEARHHAHQQRAQDEKRNMGRNHTAVASVRRVQQREHGRCTIPTVTARCLHGDGGARGVWRAGARRAGRAWPCCGAAPAT